MAIGSVIARKAAAVSSSHPCPVVALTRLAMATVIGATSEDPPRKINAISRSFQTQMNWKIATEASAGAASGSATRTNTIRSLAPSIAAASNNSPGSAAKKLRIR